jgi:hypothetical protein
VLHCECARFQEINVRVFFLELVNQELLEGSYCCELAFRGLVPDRQD